MNSRSPYGLSRSIGCRAAHHSLKMTVSDARFSLKWDKLLLLFIPPDKGKKVRSYLCRVVETVHHNFLRITGIFWYPNMRKVKDV